MDGFELASVASGSFGLTNAATLGNGTFGVGHTSNYSNNALDSYNLTVDLSGVTGSTISFDWSLDIEAGFDQFGPVGPSASLAFLSGTAYNGTWFNAPFNGFGPANWGNRLGSNSVYDLSPFDGGLVTIRIALETDGSVTDRGFFIDNILVQGNSSIPEPGTLALFGLGLAGLGFARRRKAS